MQGREEYEKILGSMVTSGITKEELITWGGPEVFSQAFAICNAGDVSDVSYDDDTLTVTGKIAQPSGWAMPVTFRLEPGGRIHSECPCVTNQRYGQICSHVVAIGIALVFKEMEEKEREDLLKRAAGEDDEESPAAEKAAAE